MWFFNAGRLPFHDGMINVHCYNFRARPRVCWAMQYGEILQDENCEFGWKIFFEKHLSWYFFLYRKTNWSGFVLWNNYFIINAYLKWSQKLLEPSSSRVSNINFLKYSSIYQMYKIVIIRIHAHSKKKIYYYCAFSLWLFPLWKRPFPLMLVLLSSVRWIRLLISFEVQFLEQFTHRNLKYIFWYFKLFFAINKISRVNTKHKINFSVETISTADDPNYEKKNYLFVIVLTLSFGYKCQMQDVNKVVVVVTEIFQNFRFSSINLVIFKILDKYTWVSSTRSLELETLIWNHLINCSLCYKSILIKLITILFEIKYFITHLLCNKI